MAKKRKKSAREDAFKVLKGRKIKSIDASAVNQLVIEDDSGNVYEIDAYTDGHGVPYLTISKFIPD